MTRIMTRYVVRDERGDELIVPSLDDLRALYVQGFLAETDGVRQERSPHWIRVADFAALHGLREARRESPIRVGAVLMAALALAAAIGIMLAH